jgi:hypothetical protein
VPDGNGSHANRNDDSGYSYTNGHYLHHSLTNLHFPGYGNSYGDARWNVQSDTDVNGDLSNSHLYSHSDRYGYSDDNRNGHCFTCSYDSN